MFIILADSACKSRGLAPLNDKGANLCADLLAHRRQKSEFQPWISGMDYLKNLRLFSVKQILNM